MIETGENPDPYRERVVGVRAGEDDQTGGQTEKMWRLSALTSLLRIWDRPGATRAEKLEQLDALFSDPDMVRFLLGMVRDTQSKVWPGLDLEEITARDAELQAAQEQRDKASDQLDTGQDRMSDQSQRETELRIELAEARTDKKFADMLGEMRAGFAQLDGRLGRLDARLDGVERATSGIKATVITTGIAAVVLVIAVLAYGQSWFGIGVSTRDVIHNAVVAEQHQQTPPAGPTKP